METDLRRRARGSLLLALNECELTNILRDTDGVVSARLSERRVARIDNRLADTVTREFPAMQFDARREQSRKARCVLRDGDEARAFITTIFSGTAGGGDLVLRGRRWWLPLRPG